jgi:pentatricopeptide repeat protein
MHTQSVANRRGKTGCHRVAHRHLAVKAAADLFIQSLVVAGFCSDHAPRKQIPPIHTTTQQSRLCTLTNSPIYSHMKRHVDNLPSVPRKFPLFATHVSHIHAKSMSTHAARKDPDDDHYHDISDEDTRTEFTKNNGPGTEEPQFPIHFVAGKGPSEWSGLLRRVLNIRKGQTKATKASKARLKKVADKIILDTRSQDFALKLFLAALNDTSKSNQYIISLYKRLPSPGVKVLTKEERRVLLYRFAHPPDRRRSNARYYLGIFDDMIQSGFKVSRSMCTSAIYFISHKVPILEGRDLQDAITVWHRMEKMYGKKSDSVVFELLFRIASTTGNFTVADRLLSEMASRKLNLSRNGQMSVIFSHGQRGDVDAIHRMFESYVQSGQIVDTVVLNCLISALLKSGELETVEQLYSRMMIDLRKTTGVAPKDRRNAVFGPSLSPDFSVWKSNARGLSSIFDNYLLSRRKLLDEKMPSLQNVVPITPDTRTFHILFRYHCLHTGDLTALGRLLMDMEQVYEVPPRSIVYYFLFRGFAIHHGTKGWTAERLEEIWRAFRRALYESYTRIGRPENEESLSPRWENPLQSICEATIESSLDHAEYYQQEEIFKSRSGETPGQKHSKSPSHREKLEGDIIPEEENLMELFDEVGQFGQFHRHWYPDEKMTRRIENGVFLSRELNIVILKAFGAHCGTDALLRVFSQIERMWKPWKRLGHDVHGVKKELQKQLVRVQNRERQSL